MALRHCTTCGQRNAGEKEGELARDVHGVRLLAGFFTKNCPVRAMRDAVAILVKFKWIGEARLVAVLRAWFGANTFRDRAEDVIEQPDAARGVRDDGVAGRGLGGC